MAGFDVGSVKAKVEADITNFQQGMREAKAEVSGFQTGLSNAGSALASFGKQAAVFTGIAAAGIGVVAKKALDMAGQFEQSEIAFTTLLKDRGKALAAIKEIEEEAKKTPYNLPDLIKANQLLISAGVNTKDARDDIRSLGNAIAATGGGTAELNRLAVNLQQIKAVGKASALDIKQFAFAGINIYKLLADSTGKTVEQVKEMDVSYEMLTDSLDKASAAGGMFEGAMDAQSKSLQGVVSNIQDVIGITLKDIAVQSGLFDAIKNGAKGLLTFIESIKQPVIGFFQEVGKIATLVTEVFNKDFDIGAWLSNEDYAKYEGFIEILRVLQGAFATFSAWVSENQELVITFLKGLAIGIGALVVIGTITALVSALLNPITLVVAAIGLLYTAWSTNFLGLRDIATAVFGVLSSLFNDVLMPIITSYTTFITENWDAIRTSTENIWSIIKGVIQIAFGAIYAIFAVMLALFTGDWKKAWEQIKQAGALAWEGVKNIFTGAFNFIKGWGSQVLDALTKPFRDAWNTISELVKKIRDAMDFTERHSPSIMDVLNKSVRLVNGAMGKFDFSPMVDQLSLPSLGVMDLTGQMAGVAPAPVSNSTRIVNQNIQATLLDGLDVNTFAEQLAYKYRNENL